MIENKPSRPTTHHFFGSTLTVPVPRTSAISSPLVAPRPATLPMAGEAPPEQWAEATGSPCHQLIERPLGLGTDRSQEALIAIQEPLDGARMVDGRIEGHEASLALRASPVLHREAPRHMPPHPIQRGHL